MNGSIALRRSGSHSNKVGPSSPIGSPILADSSTVSRYHHNERYFPFPYSAPTSVLAGSSAIAVYEVPCGSSICEGRPTQPAGSTVHSSPEACPQRCGRMARPPAFLAVMHAYWRRGYVKRMFHMPRRIDPTPPDL